jgi:hypothetical protein
MVVGMEATTATDKIMNTNTPVKNIVSIRRPSGIVEEVALKGNFIYVITAAEFEKMTRMTREAGRGEILGFISGGVKKIEIDANAGRRSRATIAAVLGGSLSENDDTSATALRGGY